jgi:uncharacterized OB-fold protein
MTMERFDDVVAPIEPVVHPDTDGFWRGLSEGELRVQECSECGTRRFPFGPVCFSCLSLEHTWVAIPLEGTVAVTAVVHRATGDQAWAAYTPFLSGLVDLAGGLRLPGQIRCTCGGAVERGAPVRAVLLSSAGGTPVHAFAHSCVTR